MKKILICLSVLSLVSVASAKRKPSQVGTGDVGQADAGINKEPAVTCYIMVNRGPSSMNVPVPASIKGSSTSGDFDSSAEKTLGAQGEFKVGANITQVPLAGGVSYSYSIYVGDTNSGIETRNMGFLDIYKGSSESAQALLLFNKNPRPIKIDGKKIEVNMLQFVCMISKNTQ